MANQPADEKEPKTANPPEQKLGDTPVAPWKMPTPEEKAAAKPVRKALRKALAEVDSQEKADAVIGDLKTATAGQTAAEVAKAQQAAATPAEAAQQIKKAEKAAPPGDTAQTVIAETARVVSAAEGREREVIAEAAQEIFNADQQGAPAAAEDQNREYLRRAVLKQLKPLDALDASLFLKINHLPHTRVLNGFFYFLTFIFTGGGAWFAMMALIALCNRRLGWRVVRDVALPLAVATWLVEHPIKWYFRRRRPFISIIQAIVIGKKPGTWSFPSGHSAAAFTGAWLLGRHFPRQRGLLYPVASLVAFSRIYLGDHYPGDVVAGSVVGTLIGMFLRRLPWPWRPK